jgi:hypothetical protein
VLTLSPVVAGCWRMAEWGQDTQDRVRWIEQCLAVGISSFDHADVYGSYTVEGLFGEALSAAPGLRDRIQIVIDRNKLEGSVDLVGDAGGVSGPEWGTAELARRSPRPDLAPDPKLPADTRLWAALQHASGGVWGGCVYDPDAIVRRLVG